MSRQTLKDRPKELTPEHVDALVELVNSAYRGDESKKGWTTEADILDGQRIDAARVREILSNPNQKVLLWPSDELSGKLDACVLLERRNAGRESVGYLGMLTVRPSLQNSGLGRQILAASEEFLRDYWKLGKVEMTVISSRQELIDWYLRRGYQQTSERREFPMTDQRFGIPKVKHIEFVVLQKTI